MITERDISFSLKTHEDIKVLTGGVKLGSQIAIDQFEIEAAGSESAAIERATKEIKARIFKMAYADIHDPIIELYHMAINTTDVEQFHRAQEKLDELLAMIRPHNGQ